MIFIDPNSPAQKTPRKAPAWLKPLAWLVFTATVTALIASAVRHLFG